MGSTDDRDVFFFDIDNCLYSRSFKIHHLMQQLIDDYFERHLQLSREDAEILHQRYYKDYGLALDGLLRHHGIDALEYNREVDDALPLEEIIKPDPQLRTLLEGIDQKKTKLWLLTNAYVTHGKRVVKLLGVDDFFEGITYCDYSVANEVYDKDGQGPGLVCKPKEEMYTKAMEEAGIADKSKCYFVDDSAINCEGAVKFGWEKVAHFVEGGLKEPEVMAGRWTVRTLDELKGVWPQLFK